MTDVLDETWVADDQGDVYLGDEHGTFLCAFYEDRWRGILPRNTARARLAALAPEMARWILSDDNECIPVALAARVREVVGESDG